jgi:hypothetical protein
MDKEVKVAIGVGGGVLVGLILMIVLLVGPIRLANNFRSWKATAYGSEWLVIQYTSQGDVNMFWDLKSPSSVCSESHSDGIYFTTTEGTIVHLSNFYIYAQNPTPDERMRLLKKAK